jgi:hypothetical protein
METKKFDKPYSNVDKGKIKKANPKINKKNFKILEDWIKERYLIHIKKDIENKNPPWTNDKILQKYKFCNIYRELDKESKWLIKNISESKINYKNKLLNTILFRLINKYKTIEIFGIIDFDKINYFEIQNKLKIFQKQNQNYIYFSSAFFMSGQKSACNKLFGKSGNMIIKMIKLVESYYKEGIIKKIESSENQHQVYEELKLLKGIGNFLSYQIFVDLTYIKEFPYSENEFVVAGPGCKKGLKLIFENFDGLNFNEVLFWLRDSQIKLFSKNLFKILPKEKYPMNIMSLENIMCEISKYIRVKDNTGRPRVLYRQKLTNN